MPNADEGAGRQAGAASVAAPAVRGVEGRTRATIVRLLLEEGPITATAIGSRLGLSPAGVRRHLDALIDSGQARAARSAPWQQKGRGRPAKQYQLTAAGRGRLGHAYDDLAGAAIRQLGEVGGDQAIADFARKRARNVVDGVEPLRGPQPEGGPTATESITPEPAAAENGEATVAKAEEIADALSEAGFAASTRKVGAGVQICQHHCPVAHVAEEFPQLCEAELDTFRELLGTHVQRLATIANGDCACTTHVPLTVVSKATGVGGQSPARIQKKTTADTASPSAVAQPATVGTNDSGRSAE